MNDKDKEPFKSWFEQDRKEFEAREPATYTDSDEWCMRKGWIAACKYKDKEYSNLMDAMSKTSQYNFKLQAENKKLREALEKIAYHVGKFPTYESYCELKDKAREALKEIRG